MSPAAWTLAGVFVTALVTLIGLLMRQSRRSPDQRQADAAVWGTLRSGYDARITELTGELNRLRTDVGAARTEAAAATQEVAWLRITVASLVRPLVAWIDSGAQPPPPAIPDALRRLLDEVASHRPPDPGP